MLEDIFARPELIEAMATITAFAVLGVVTLAAAQIGAARLRIIWLAARGRVPEVIDAVDEPDDAVNKSIDKYLDRLLPANWDQYAAYALPVFFRSLADGLDRVLQPETAPESTDAPH